MSTFEPLEVGKTYRMTDWRIAELELRVNRGFGVHIGMCDNRFTVLAATLPGSNRMKCLGCGEQYNSNRSDFYEPVDNLSTGNPNILFCKRRKS